MEDNSQYDAENQIHLTVCSGQVVIDHIKQTEASPPLSLFRVLVLRDDLIKCNLSQSF